MTTCSATLHAASCLTVAHGRDSGTREGDLDRARALDRFLQDVEKRAFRIAEIAVGDPDDALDVVQDAMLHLVRAYGRRPCEEWRPLFYRILQNRIHDCRRRRRTRSRVIAWWTGGMRADDEEPGAPDPIETAPGRDPGPRVHLENAEALAALEAALRELPERQQQAFVLRNLEGLDVAATAVAMGCSEGSVKTHLFRAMQSLRTRLGEHWS